MKKKIISLLTITAIACTMLASCGKSSDSTASNSTATSTATASETTDDSETAPSESTVSDTTGNDTVEALDYFVLVNKLNPLPEDWEEKLEIESCVNTVGNTVEVEKKAYDAYLKLKADLEDEGIYVDLDSAYRSVAEQQRIMDDFIEQYGIEYATKTVATPGYSEHHTGLALDLYLIIDGVDVDENEDMIQYVDIWATIHEKLPQYGFILRYLDGKEYITGYGYEPWHLRYIDDPDKAAEITASGVTLEEYLGAVNTTDVTFDYGTSTVYTAEDIEAAALQVKCKFATFEGCELHSLRYAGDENNGGEGKIVFLMDFHTPAGYTGDFDADTEIKDYKWTLSKSEKDGWQIEE